MADSSHIAALTEDLDDNDGYAEQYHDENNNDDEYLLELTETLKKEIEEEFEDEITRKIYNIISGQSF